MFSSGDSTFAQSFRLILLAALTASCCHIVEAQTCSRFLGQVGSMVGTISAVGTGTGVGNGLMEGMNSSVGFGPSQTLSTNGPVSLSYYGGAYIVLQAAGATWNGNGLAQDHDDTGTFTFSITPDCMYHFSVDLGIGSPDPEYGTGISYTSPTGVTEGGAGGAFISIDGNNLAFPLPANGSVLSGSATFSLTANLSQLLPPPAAVSVPITWTITWNFSFLGLGTPSCTVPNFQTYGQYNAPVFNPSSAKNTAVTSYPASNTTVTVPQYLGFLPTPNSPSAPPHALPFALCPTIKSGCALSSVATMLTSFSGLGGINPSVLNSDLIGGPPYWLDSATISLCPLASPNCSSGFTKFPDWCEMPWNSLDTAFQNQIQEIDSQQLNAQGTLFDEFQAEDVPVDQYLNDYVCTNQARVILQLHDNVSGGQHFVFVTGQNGSDWNVFDPGWRNASTTLSGHIAGFPTTNSLGQAITRTFTVTGVRTYWQPPTGNNSTLSFTAESPIELLVVDPMGRQLGNQNGSDVFGIPHGSYTTDFPFADDDSTDLANGDPTGIKQAHVNSPLAGTYKVTSTGTGLGSYTLIFQSVATDGTTKTATVSGVTNTGSVSTYEVSYSPTSGMSGSVSLMATYESTLADIANSLQLKLIVDRGTADVLEILVKGAQANASQGRDQAARVILEVFQSVVRLSAQLKLLEGVAPQVLEGDGQSLISQLPPPSHP